MQDEILAAIRAVHKPRMILVQAEVDGIRVTGTLSEDTNEQLAKHAQHHRKTKEEILVDIYILKNSVDDEAVDSYLFGDPS